MKDEVEVPVTGYGIPFKKGRCSNLFVMVVI